MVILGAVACVPVDGVAPDAEPDEVSLSAVIDGQRLVFDNGVRASARSSGGSIYVEVSGAGGHRPGVKDDGWALTVALEIDANSPVRVPLRIRGETRFALPSGMYTYLLADSDIGHTATAGEAPSVRRVWVRYTCFCTRYRADTQSLEGTLTIRSRSSARITGTLHLDLDGAIPFWAGGFGTPVAGTFDANFAAAL